MIGKKLDALLVRMDSVLDKLNLMRDDAKSFRDTARDHGGIAYNDSVSMMCSNVPTHEEVQKMITRDIEFNNWFQGLNKFHKALYGFVEENTSGSDEEKKRKTEALIKLVEGFE